MGEPVDVRIEAADAVAQSLRQHRDHSVGKINAVSAPTRFSIQCAAGLNVSGDVCNVHAETPATPGFLNVNCIVEITRPNHCQDGTKDLLLGDGGAWSNVADYRRLDEEAIFVADAAASQNLPAFAGTFVDVLLDLLHR